MAIYSKFLKNVLLASALVMTLPACDDFLEEDPKNFVGVTNFYKTQDDAIAAVNAIYAYLNSTSTGSTAGVYHSSFWVTAGLASDEMFNNQFSTDLEQISNFTHSPQNATLLEIWAMHYKAISVANIALERIPGIAMDEALKARLLAEAHFLRGLLYFDMVRMYGSVPLLLKEVEPLTPQPASVDKIYEQIILDLKAAESLPASYQMNQGRGRATKGAAKAVLAKVYLTMEEWEKSAEKSLEVINSNQYELHEDYADVFKLENRNGKEAIFSIGFGDAGGTISFWEVGQFLVRLLPAEMSAAGVVDNAQGWQLPTETLYDAFEPGDRRREVTFITEFTKQDGSVVEVRPHIQKYWDREAEPRANGTFNDFPLLRYADVLLMYAEASNELGDPVEAHKYLNMVRKRARFDGEIYRDVLPDYENLSKEVFRKAVLEERWLEFVAEGHRWFDLVRTGTLEEKVPLAKPGVTPSSTHYLFPIPQRERDLNSNLPQNTGY